MDVPTDILTSGNGRKAELDYLFPLTILISIGYIFICSLCFHSVNVLLTPSPGQLGSYFRRTGGVLGERSFGSVYQLREKKLALAQNLRREMRWKIHFLSWTLWQHSFFFFAKKKKKNYTEVGQLSGLSRARHLFLLYLHMGQIFYGS